MATIVRAPRSQPCAASPPRCRWRHTAWDWSILPVGRPASRWAPSPNRRPRGSRPPRRRARRLARGAAGSRRGRPGRDRRRRRSRRPPGAWRRRVPARARPAACAAPARRGHGEPLHLAAAPGLWLGRLEDFGRTVTSCTGPSRCSAPRAPCRRRRGLRPTAPVASASYADGRHVGDQANAQAHGQARGQVPAARGVAEQHDARAGLPNRLLRGRQRRFLEDRA